MTRTPAPAPSRSLAAMVDGYLTTQLLYIIAELRLADHLAAGPRNSQELSEEVGLDVQALHRLLRGLAADGVLEEHPGAAFSLTDLGQQLRSDHPQSLRGAILARGALYFAAAAQLLPALQAGGIPFDHAYGLPLFDYLSANPAAELAFQQSMAARAERDRADLLATYDFAGARHVVDVGGGSGTMLAAILHAYPHLQATLMDRPETIPLARAELAVQGVLERVSLVDGDFFSTVPSGGDCYLLSRIMHDWDDARALQILESCHAAMAPGAYLLLLEAVLPELAADNPAAVRMDLHMLLLLPGRERTAAEFAALLQAAGFHSERVISTPSSSGVHVIEAVRQSR
ncbi:MAG TPA: methyltransferase [Lautropia sp.]|nr:methyltransferase [Lautropia sp.]